MSANETVEITGHLMDHGILSRVLDDSDQSDATQAIKTFNDKIAADERVTCVQLTIRDGVTLIRKR